MQRIVVSIDAMGGANAPEAIVEAMSLAVTRNNGLYFIVCGEEWRLKELIVKYPNLQGHYELIAATSVVQDHDKPLHAFKNGKDSSMRKAIDCVKEGLAHACLSCGNTGALLVTAKMVLGMLSGVKRPAIVGMFPTMASKSIMLDMGANNECSELVLFQFALMGRSLAKIILHIENPSIAILNVGEEETKGREIEQKAAVLLRNSGLNFIGYIEGHDIAQGKADVVVTDGFSGNIVIKASEGAAHLCIALLKNACTKSGVIASIGAFLLKRALKRSLGKIDPNVNNGAMFIGLNGIVIKSHGGAAVAGIVNAIDVAYQLAVSDINTHIVQEMRQLEESGIGLNLVKKLKQTLGIPA